VAARWCCQGRRDVRGRRWRLWYGRGGVRAGRYGRRRAWVPGRADELSARERELVTLVAQGRTDADIAAQLYISIRTVRSHLDRIRDKTGCRRRADLTRLALAEGLV
jgi:DNA-binding CsgD family transcriptional regulator